MNGVAQLVRNPNIGNRLVPRVGRGNGKRYAGRRWRTHLDFQIDLDLDHCQRNGGKSGKRLGLSVHIIRDRRGGYHIGIPHGIDKRLCDFSAGIERMVAENRLIADLLVDNGDIRHVKLRIV